MTGNGAERNAGSQETMNAGPRPVSRRSRRLAVVVAVVLIAGGAVGWRAWVAYTDIVTQPELRSAYTVRPASNGRAISDRGQRSTPLAGCPAIKAVIGRSAWPIGTLDGQSGGDDGGPGPAGLMSFRYPDRLTARNTFDRFVSAVAACPILHDDTDASPDLRLDVRPSTDTSLDVTLTGTSGPPYVFEVAVSQYKNVVTWAVADLSDGIPAGRAPAALRTFDTGLAATDHIGG